MQKRIVFFVSDRTGLTTQAVGESLLTQFEGIEVKHVFFPFVDSVEKAAEVAELITEVGQMSGLRPVVFCTIMDDQIREVIKKTDSFVLDYFEQFIGPLEEELGMLSSHVVVKHLPALQSVSSLHSFSSQPVIKKNEKQKIMIIKNIKSFFFIHIHLLEGAGG